MLSRTSLVQLLLVVLWAASSSHAFLTPRPVFKVVAAKTVTGDLSSPSPSASALNFFKKKKEEEDLSFIETRDMTREEMQALNQKNEEIMNAELIGMTLFSLVLSVPMLYLVWVGFFAETAGVVEDF
jgi:hypothetical protein